MGFQFTALQPIVTVTGFVATALPYPSVTQTLVSKYSAVTTTAYTVPAGKTFYLMGATCHFEGSALICVLQDDDTYNFLKLQSAAGEIATVSASCPIRVFLENTSVKRTNNACSLLVWGYLVDN